MRSTMTWVVVATAALSAGIACSDDNSNEPSMQMLPNQPGTAGTGGAPGVMGMAGMTNTQQNPGSEQPPVQPPQMMGGMQSGAANTGGTGGGGGTGGAPPMVADAGATPDAPDAAPPGGEDPPDMDSVGFSDVFPLLVASCGGCHGANAPGARPRFAQTGNEAASLTAAQAMSPQGGTVAARIIARAVTQRNMPPACGGQALGTGACLDAAEAALLQDWVAQGLQP